MENKVESVLNGAMDGLKNLVDVDTVIGDPIKVNDDVTLIPISKVTCGFASGGSGFGSNPQNEHFGGGAGGCVKVNPVCFLVVRGDNVRMLPVSDSMSGVDKLVDLIPDMVDKISGLIAGKKEQEI
jgi:sporulation protein YtfJ